MRLPDFIWLNGSKIFPGRNDNLPIDILLDRATSFGDGIFETMLVKNSRIAFIESHLKRLFEGVSLLNLDYDINKIQYELNLSLSCLDSKFTYVVKYMLSRGSSVFGYGSKNIKANSFIIIEKLHHTNQLPLKLMICSHKVSCMPGMTGIKHCNRLDQVIAKREVEVSNTDDGIMLDHDDNIVETTASNIFIFEGDMILTPILSNFGIKGVIREILLKKIFPVLELSASEKNINIERVLKSDGCFITNSIQGPRLIKEINFSNKIVKLPQNKIFNDILRFYNNLLVE